MLIKSRWIYFETSDEEILLDAFELISERKTEEFIKFGGFRRIDKLIKEGFNPELSGEVRLTRSIEKETYCVFVEFGYYKKHTDNGKEL